MRDFQRSAVYTAEQGHALYDGYEMSLEEVRDFCCEVFCNQNVLNLWGQWIDLHELQIHDGRRRRTPCAKGKVHDSGNSIHIILPTFSRTRLIVLHELAHLLTPRKFSSHGMEYASNYLYLIGLILGEDHQLRSPLSR